MTRKEMAVGIVAAGIGFAVGAISAILWLTPEAEIRLAGWLKGHILRG